MFKNLNFFKKNINPSKILIYENKFQKLFVNLKISNFARNVGQKTAFHQKLENISQIKESLDEEINLRSNQDFSHSAQSERLNNPSPKPRENTTKNKGENTNSNKKESK